jgi:hypothetical protein
MKGVNFGRVILGGLVAGVVINISEFVLNTIVLKSQMEEGMKALGKTVPQSGGTIAVWTILGFAMGIASVWLYAAIRPRYGAGPATAARAGVAVWFFASLVCTIVIVNMGLFPFNLLPVVWTLAQAIIATIIGAWLYKEDGTTAAMA